MSIAPKALAVASIAVFFAACVYVGFINEQLKSAISTFDRVIVMIGFIIGAAAISRYLTEIGDKHLAKTNRTKGRG